MFDGLKETLGRFREDVEEEIEPDGDEPPADEAATDEPEADEAAEDATTVEEADDAGAEPEAATETAADEEDRTGGFARRAKSLARGRRVIDEEDLEGPLDDLELALLSNDVEMGVAEAILDRVREELVGETRALTTRTGSVVESALREALLSVVDVGDADFETRIQEADRPVVVIFTGVNGVGKTTSIAKVARYLEDRGRSVVLANGDTFRAGANEQLREHAEALGLKLIAHEQGGDPAAVLYDAVEYARANDVDVVLGDTAGRLHTDHDLMAQLEKIDRVVDPDLTVFVDEAVAGQDAVHRARQFDEAAAIDGTVLAKADADTAGGAAISIAHVTGKPILFLGTGQSYDDLEAFDPEAIAGHPVRVDGWSLSSNERETSSGFTRKTTVFALEGAGEVGRGEDVTYTPEAHDVLRESPPSLPLDGEQTLATAGDALDDVDLFPVDPPERETFRHYRRWAVESALLDLALRQAGTDLAGALDREAAPVRFVVSTSLGEPATADPVERWLDVDPTLEFKVDATEPWPDDVVETLVETGQVRTVDLKALYVDDDEDAKADADEPWQGRADAAFYRRLLDAFPEAVFEDPGVTDATRPVLEPKAHRLSWDAPVHSVAEFEALPLSVGWCNVKPSRFGSLERLFDFLDFARAEGIRLYGGGQFELGVGRGQLQELGSLFYPDGPNDVAPRSYNDPEPRAGLPPSPLDPPDPAPGFGWPPPEDA